MANLPEFAMSAGGKRNRTAVTRVSYVKRGGIWVKTKTIPTLAPLLPRAAVSGQAEQFRILAEESRELLADRVFASRIQTPGRDVVMRMPVLRKPDMPAVAREPFNHKDLTRRYVLWKARNGQDGRILLATGDYVAGIEVFKGFQRARKGLPEAGVYYMVRPANRKHRPSGLPLSKIARILEKGSARYRIPARPHWGPTVRDVITEFKKRRTRAYKADILRRALRGIS